MNAFVVKFVNQKAKALGRKDHGNFFKTKFLKIQVLDRLKLHWSNALSEGKRRTCEVSVPSRSTMIPGLIAIFDTDIMIRC